MDRQPIDIRHIWEARRRIRPLVGKTPLVESEELSRLAGGPVFLKMETHHEIHAFKIRGAANKILRLAPEDRKRGVTTFSTGNHGMAVASIARRLDIPAVICVSRNVPAAKTEAIRRLGAKLHVHGESQDEAESACYRLQREEGLSVIPPFDDPDIIAGQGTIGLELMEDLPELQTAVIPLSGGGLLAGIGMAVKTNQPDSRVIGVTMEGPAVMHYSLKEGKPLVMRETATLADSLLGGIGTRNRYTFDMVRHYADDSVLVSENQIVEGIAFLLNHHRTLAEGAAATTVAAVLSRKFSFDGKPAVLIISGANIDSSTLFETLEKASRSSYPNSTG
ncbi:threonine dehydratase [Melghirimyces profundicolus]|uniref:threonine ammonia-lyase n=1 Tax=Melghirimyces profundicolus TaxID=1242148 RepID=A0A2T6BQU1_9BACL|nr:threonine/serine dehydratase [Melghirimyces profundicolus]PTX58460.1 threonine dehydratase [Melghirimyces profundicolus]